MKIYYALEGESMVMGVSLLEARLIVSFLLGGVLLGSLVDMLTAIPIWYYMIWVGLTIIVYVLCRIMRQNAQPKFLLSFISFHFFQPRQIIMDDTLASFDPILSQQLPQ